MKHATKAAALVITIVSLASCSSQKARIDDCQKDLGISRDACALKIQQEDAQSAANWRWAASQGAASAASNAE